MPVYRIKARTAKSARNKATTKNRICTGVNYIKGTKDGAMRTYSVRTKPRK